ncbi:MAG: MFS transporter [Lachnospiraceae bacterium]|nr:MFS transporter [Lachnospiraceae bacterium]
MSKEKKTLRNSEIVGYGLGGMFTYGFQLAVTGYYLMYFMTDVIGFSAMLAATIYSAIQWIKMGTMVFSGVIIDTVNFKSGKYRTWTLISGIGLGIFFPLSFVYFGLPTSAYVVVFLALYSLMTLCYNVGWTSMRALIGKMSKNSSDVVLLNTSAQIGGTASGVLYGYIGYPILGIALWAGTKQAYAGASAIYGFLIILGAVFLYGMSKKYENSAAEEAVKEKQARIGFGQMLSALKGPMIPFFCSYSFSAAQAGFFNTLLVYYTTYVLNNPQASALAISWVAIAGLVGCFVSPSLTKKMSKKNIHIGCQALSAVGYIALALFGKSTIPFIVIRSLISFVGTPSQIVMSALCNDIGDNVEMHEGEAPRAFLQGLTGTTTRVGLVMSAMIASFGLAAIGYSQGMEFTGSMVTKLVALIAVGPAIVCALSALCMLFYRLDEKDIAEYNRKKFQSAQ